MSSILQRYLKKFKNNRKKRNKAVALLCMFSIIVAGSVFWQLRIVGITMSEEACCGNIEHTHTEACKEKRLICGKKEGELEGEPELICTKPEHKHNEKCYKTEKVLVCDNSDPDHVHTEECYEEKKVLVCKLEEHTHDDACWSKGKPHVHTEECYETVYTCGLEEHEHTLECYSDKTADLETEKDWIKTLPKENSGVWADDILANALSQVDYTESSKNFKVAEDGKTRNGYSRYGEWYGTPYDEWNTIFTSFCLNYADIPVKAVPQNSKAEELYKTANKLGICETNAYIPKPGDIIFLKSYESRDLDRTAVVKDYVEKKDNTITLTVIEGDVEGAVKEIEYDLSLEKDNVKKVSVKNSDNVYSIEAYINIASSYDKALDSGVITEINQESLEGKNNLNTDNNKEQLEQKEPDIAAQQSRLTELLKAFDEKGIALGNAIDDDLQNDVKILKKDMDTIYKEAKDIYIALNPTADEKAFQEMLNKEHTTAWLNYQKAEELLHQEPVLSEPVKGETTAQANVDEDTKINADVSVVLRGNVRFPVAPGERPKEDVWNNISTNVVAIGSDTEDFQSFISYGDNNNQNYINLVAFDINYLYNESSLDVSECTQEVNIGPKDNIIKSAVMPITTFALEEPSKDTSNEEKQFTISLLEKDKEGNIKILQQVQTSVDGSNNIKKMTATSPAGSKYALAVTENANPTFIVQYYANVPQAVKANGPGEGLNTNITVINTVGKNLPENNKSNPKIYLETENLSSSGKFNVKYKAEHRQIFLDKQYSFNKAPGVEYIDIVSREVNSNYTLNDTPPINGTHRLWVYENKEDADKDKDGTNKSLRKEYDPTKVKFTNTYSEETDTLQIKDGMVIRLVYEPSKDENHEYPTQFWDYDITNGKNSDGTYSTAYYGINSSGNYKGHASNDVWYTFGNGNMGVRWDSMKLNGYYVNKANGDVDGGCHFGLMNRTNPKRFANGSLYAPAMMGPDTNVVGKYPVDGYKLGFHRNGDTYILTHVKDNNNKVITSGLGRFSQRDNWNKTRKFYANDFWPMDGVHNKDPHWGKENTCPKYVGLNDETGQEERGSFPKTDDGLVHNPYFGMLFDIDFTMTGGYVGPLEYMFFGDDDLWVYLQKIDQSGKVLNSQLVCDVGGVHSSVGEYVDLWDYVNKPTEDDGQVEKYRLRCIYTERGASGSTCYMNFTLPNITAHIPEEQNGSLRVEKEVIGITQNDGQKFDFKLDLSNTSVSPNNIYNYYVYDKNNTESYIRGGTIKSGGILQLGHNEYAVINGLPEGATYKIEEINVDSSYVTTVKTGTVADNLLGDPVNSKYHTGTISSTSTDVVHFINETSVELPHTGGKGTAIFILGGMLLILCSAIWLYQMKWRKEGRLF